MTIHIFASSKIHIKMRNMVKISDALLLDGVLDITAIAYSLTRGH